MPVPFYADLHIHSKYSRACSRDCDLEHLAWWARRKGITVVGTGDFTHPAWHAELKERLVPAEPGVYRLDPDLDAAVRRTLPASCQGEVRFLLSVEISTIYKYGGATRKVHHLIYLPDLDAVERFNTRLGRIGNITSDGRPILGLDSRDLLEIALEASEDAWLVPAHIWTPWFAVLGAKSGFDSVADCYRDLAHHLFAVETGLSADPAMLWRVSSLDAYTPVGNSDAHSPPMLGRELSLFDSEWDYYAIREALRTRRGFLGPREFFPEEGKYHHDGHRKCGVRMTPEETRARDGLCPGCGKPVTIGVAHRVATLADRPAGTRPPNMPDFVNLVALPQIIGEIRGVGPRSKSVLGQVASLVSALGPELNILEQVPLDAIADAGGEVVAEAIGRLRRGEVIREAGYDGEYGVIRLFAPGELGGADTLFDLEPVAAPARGPKARAAVSPTYEPELVGGEELYDGDDAVEGGVLPGLAPTLLDGLDADQRAAAQVTEGPLLVVAGPGTGKTRTLTHRIAHLVAERGVPADQVLAVTFTRKARAELAERLAGLLPPADAAAVDVATFHGLGLAILREHPGRAGLTADFRIAEPAVRLELAAELLGGASKRDCQRALDRLARHRRAGAGDPELDPELDDLLDRYGKALRSRDLVDLDELVWLPVRMLDADPELAAAYRERWRYVSVDEYQDVDAVQYRLLRLLSAGNLCAIGDPDQAIYAFRGADVRFFLDFRRDFPGAKVVALTRNYRSSPAIVAGALDAIAPATLVPGRQLRAVGTAPAPARIVVHTATDEADEAGWLVRTVEALLGGSSLHARDTGVGDTEGVHLSFADIAVLYRTDAQTGPLVEAFDRAGIPVQKRTHDRLGDRLGVAPVVHHLRLGTGPLPDRLKAAARTAAAAADDGAAEGAALAAADLLAPLAARYPDDLDGFLDELALGAEVDTLDPRADRIALLTLHAAKGLEFPVVFLVGCEDGLLPLTYGDATDDDLAEERRLFFVGLTRARQYLFLTRARRRLRQGTVRDQGPSPFLADIRATLRDHRETTTARPRPRERQLRLI